MAQHVGDHGGKDVKKWKVVQGKQGTNILTITGACGTSKGESQMARAWRVMRDKGGEESKMQSEE
ncbi:hypothetical protein Dimus_033992, partial [Dionaea muscipula]